jgi:hypothetical protein
MQIAGPSDVARRDVGTLREGEMDDRVLLTGTEGDLDNYRVQLGRAKTDWLTPHHHHNFDQVRLALEGEFYYAENKLLPAGWVGYFPETTYYGPQIRKAGLHLLLVQFGGASRIGFVSERQRRAGHDALRKKGTIGKGKYTYVDDKGVTQTKDAYEAAWEEAMGRPISYAEPRYSEIIAMNPASYSWVEPVESRGIAYKWLGSFSERATRVGFIKLDAGATYDAGVCPAPELLFVTQGSVSVGDRTCGVHTAIGCERMEGPVRVKASKPSELFVVQIASPLTAQAVA